MTVLSPDTPPPSDLSAGSFLIKGTAEYEKVRCANFSVAAHDRPTSSSSGGGGGDSAHPAAIVTCKTIADVQACIRFATTHNLTITVRSGGHNYFGSYLRDDVLLVDVKELNSIVVDPESGIATIGPAAQGCDLNRAAAEHGLCFSTGHCVGVPLGGYLLGGGLGWFTPYFGLACEHVEEIVVVDPTDGKLVTAKEGDDWMWMARGSGSAFPGIVVEFKIKLAPLPPIVRCKIDLFPVEDYARLVKFMNATYSANKDDTKVEVALNLVCTPPPLADVVKVPKLTMVIQTRMADSEDEFSSAQEPYAADKFPCQPLLPGTFNDFATFADLSQQLAGAYPPGFHWIGRATLHGPDSFNNINWDKVQSTYIETAPMGLSHVLVSLYPPREAKKAGCFGSHAFKGPLSIVYGVHASEEDRKPAQDWVDTTLEVIQSHMWRYDPLEYPLNKDTFAKSFPEGVAEKMSDMRAKLDPQSRIFDPSKAEP